MEHDACATSNVIDITPYLVRRKYIGKYALVEVPDESATAQIYDRSALWAAMREDNCHDSPYTHPRLHTLHMMMLDNHVPSKREPTPAELEPFVELAIDEWLSDSDPNDPAIPLEAIRRRARAMYDERC